MNKLWLRSEGFANAGKMSDGDHEVLYDRPIPRMRFFDAQAGIRADLDSGPKRVWGAAGIEGLAPHFSSLNRRFTSVMWVIWQAEYRVPMICYLHNV
jgi:copper resistance protein B